MNILIVDDDVVDRESVIRSLSKSDLSYTYNEVESVSDAIIAINRTQYDVILLDYNLPRENGIALLHQIKNDSDNKNIAIIMMSSSENDDLALECVNAGAQDFLIKSDINSFRLQRAIKNAQVRHELESKLFNSYESVKSLAEKDSLTNLPNRYSFDKTLSNIDHNTDSSVSLLLLDLDHFKYINDSYGHNVGDDVLVHIANEVSSILTEHCHFYRLGGDEFAILLTSDDSDHDSILLANTIINQLDEPFLANEVPISLGMSIGISTYLKDTNNTSDLFKYADIAMYYSKGNGRNQATSFQHHMKQAFLHDFNIEAGIRQSLEKKEFKLHYQPVMNLTSQTIVGFEALIRWNHNGQAINPEQFIPVAEKSLLIHELGRWVIKSAIEQFSEWCDGRFDSQSNPPVTMAINLSSVQLTRLDLVEYIVDIAESNKVALNRLEFEITETALIDNSQVVNQVINGLSHLGCRISLDDFGTGFSSISHLHRFPIDIVKLDKSIVSDDSEKSRELLRGLILMVQSLNLDIIAEGIENKDDFLTCLNLGIERAQGYYFSRPVAAEDIVQLVIEAKKGES
ncbi:EAL domain-containing protein [Vibrio sp.]|nr:EAL domain-containing protein [Vibrio sp.]